MSLKLLTAVSNEKLKQGDHRKDSYSGLVRMALRQHLQLVTIQKGAESTLVN